ncbi:outer membrane beta-barrel protein, partial [Acinetobacter baumannii]
TDLTSYILLANLYVDIPVGLGLTPYVGAGIGAAWNDLKGLDYTVNGRQVASEGGKSTTNFAWSATAGLAYAVTDSLLIDFGYRYIDAG